MTVDDRMRTAASSLLAEARATTDPDAALIEVTRRGARPPRGRLLAVAAAVVLLVGAAAVLVARTGDDGEGVVAATTVGPVVPDAIGVPLALSKTTDLVDGQTLDVAAEGLTPDTSYLVTLCLEDALVTEDTATCRYSGTASDVGADGRLDDELVVRRTWALDGRFVDCASDDRCSLAVIDAGRPGQQSTMAIVGATKVSFTPQGPAPEPQLNVTPADGLRHGQVVTLTGADFAGPIQYGLVCADGSARSQGDIPPGCVQLTLGTNGPDTPTDAEGRFTAEVAVFRTFPGGDGELVDCVEVGCTLQVTGDDGRAAPAVPIAFDRAAPAPTRPVVTVSPSTSLHPGDPIVVTVEGIRPRQVVQLQTCGEDADGSVGCQTAQAFGRLVGDADGRATTSVAAPGPDAFGAACTQPGACTISLGDDVLEQYPDPLLITAEPVPVTYAP